MKQLLGILTFFLLLFSITSCCDKPIKSTESSGNVESEEIEMKIVNIYVGESALEMVLEDNKSAKEFYQKLEESDVVVSMDDYGNFEKVGTLGFNIVRSDEYITTEPGDVILYLGNTITIYYDENSWNFTLLGKIKNMTRESMLSFFGGKGKVEVRFSLN